MAAFKKGNEAHTQQDLRVNLIHRLVKKSDIRHEAFFNEDCSLRAQSNNKHV